MEIYKNAIIGVEFDKILTSRNHGLRMKLSSSSMTEDLVDQLFLRNY